MRETPAHILFFEVSGRLVGGLDYNTTEFEYEEQKKIIKIFMNCF